MSKLLVLSDSHRSLTGMENAVRIEKPDYILHLGDMSADAALLADAFPELPLVNVPGNCDWPSEKDAASKLLDFDGVRVFMTHGHRYDVKRGLGTIARAGREAGADVVLFGHTHRRFCRFEDGIWFLNPGACGVFEGSYGVVEIKNGTAVCRLSQE